MNLNNIKNRAKKVALGFFIVIAILLIYFLILYKFNLFKFKCIFHEITGLNCPGCGITRMISNFIKGDFINGIKYNYFLGYTFIIVIFIIGYSIYSYISNKKIKYIEWFNILYLSLFILWGIIRNILKV